MNSGVGDMDFDGLQFAKSRKTDNFVKKVFSVSHCHNLAYPTTSAIFLKDACFLSEEICAKPWSPLYSDFPQRRNST